MALFDYLSCVTFGIMIYVPVNIMRNTRVLNILDSYW